MVKVAVIVPHYQDLERLDICLSDLERQTYPRDQFEIIVADNASPVGEAAVAAVTRDRATLVICHERGAGPARNAAVTASRSEILAFIDADCRPDTNWLAQGVDALSRFDLVGGRMEVLVEDAAAVTGAEAFELVFAFKNAEYVAKGFSVTANLFCPRRIFDEVGGFRTQVSEDKDWSLRAKAAGFRIGYAADAVVGHPARRTWDQLLGKWRRLNSEAFTLALQDRNGRARWFAKTLLLPVSALAHTPRVLASPALRGWSQKISALSVLFRLRLWRFVDSLRLLRRPA